MDPYAVLGVAPGAPADEIRRAYRHAVLAWHPDRNPDPDAPAVFHAVQDAYERLRDMERSRMYRAQVDGEDALRTLRYAVDVRPEWVPPRHEREPLRFVLGEGWTSIAADGHASAAVPDRPRAPAPARRRWAQDERFTLAAALVAAVGGGVAIAIAPLIS